MRQWLKKHNIFMRLFSLVLSVALWFLVIGEENPTRSIEYRDIPVTLTSVDRLRTQYNLVLADDESPTVSAAIQGLVRDLQNIDPSSITAYADVSAIKEPGEYSLPCVVAPPPGFSLQSGSQKYITVHFDEVISRELPVYVYVSGNMPADYEAETAVADPTQVRVSGLRQAVEKLAAAQIHIEAGKLTQSIDEDMSFTLVDDAGNTVRDSKFSFDVSKVHVSIEVFKHKLVPLEVSLIDGLGAIAADAAIKITPAAVEVRGDIETVDKLERIVLGEVDLASFHTNYAAVMRIPLPDGLELLGETHNAAVEVSFPDLETKQIIVNDIQVVNIPLRYTVQSESDSVAVTVRGPKNILDNLVSGDISLLVDLENMTLISGRQQVEAQVILGENARELGIFGSYTVVIRSEQINDSVIFD